MMKYYTERMLFRITADGWLIFEGFNDILTNDDDLQARGRRHGSGRGMVRCEQDPVGASYKGLVFGAVMLIRGLHIEVCQGQADLNVFDFVFA